MEKNATFAIAGLPC